MEKPTQLKTEFSLLLEKTASNSGDYLKEKSLKDSVTELTMKHQNFNNVFKEMANQNWSSQFHIPVPDKNNQSEAVSISKEAACRLCPKLLMQVSADTTENGLLTDEAHFAADVILTAVENISKKTYSAELSQCVANLCRNSDMPLDVIWLIISHSSMDMEQYILLNSTSDSTIGKFTKSLAKACGSGSSNTEKTKQVIADILGFLIILKFSEEVCTQEQSNKNCKRVAGIILDAVIKSNGTLSSDKGLLDMPSPATTDARLNIYELAADNNLIDLEMLRKFFAKHISLILTHSPTHKVTKAIGEHANWSYSKTPTYMNEIFKQLLKPFRSEQAKDLLQRIIEQNEVNWKYLLMFVSHIVILYADGSQMLQSLIKCHVDQAFLSFELDRLISAFILARHAGLEGSHVFPSYSDWFHTLFSDLTSSPANNKKALAFLMKFLSDLVPFEPAKCLKVHLLHPPAVPAKSRSLLSDYILLAKLRLKDLKESIDDVGLYDIPICGETNEVKQKLLQQAQSDVEKALQTYEKVGKIPGNIMEASIFRKPYYIGRFLPALLVPRPLPDAPDLKMKFISDLKKAGKIPSSLYHDYESACRKETAHLLEGVFTSDPVEDLLLEPLEEFQELLVRFIGIVLQSAHSEKSAESISEYLAALMVKLRLLIGEEESYTEEVVVDLQSPEINRDHLTLVDLLLNNFCHTIAALSTVKSLPDNQWAAKFVSIFLSFTVLQKPLFYRLWELIGKQGVLLSEHHSRGLAAFLVHLTSLLASVNSIKISCVKDKISDLWSTIPSTNLVDTIFKKLPLSTSDWMDFSLRFCTHYLEYAITSNHHFTPSYVECHDKAYIPIVLLQKFLYLVTRSYPVARLRNFTVPKDGPVALLLFQSEEIQNHLKNQKISLKDWVLLEFNIDPYKDQLSESNRLDYVLWFIKHSFYYDDSSEIPASVVFRVLVEKTNQESNAIENSPIPTSRYVLLLLLQTLLLETNDNKTPLWIFRELEEFLSGLKDTSDLRNSLISFFSIVQFLPPYILLLQSPNDCITNETVLLWSRFINDTLRNTTMEGAYLNFTVTSIFLKAFLHRNLSTENSNKIMDLLSQTPLLLASLMIHWPKLNVETKLIQAPHVHVLLTRQNKCMEWVQRVLIGEAYNLPDDVDDWLAALVLAVKYVELMTAPTRHKGLVTVGLSSNVQKYFYLFLLAIVAAEALSQETEVPNCYSYKLVCGHATNFPNIIDYLDDNILNLPIAKKVISESVQKLYPVVAISILLDIWDQQPLLFQHNPKHIQQLLKAHSVCADLLRLQEENKLSVLVFNMHAMIALDHMVAKVISHLPTNVLARLSKEVIQGCDSHIRYIINNKLT